MLEILRTKHRNHIDHELIGNCIHLDVVDTASCLGLIIMGKKIHLSEICLTDKF